MHAQAGWLSEDAHALHQRLSAPGRDPDDVHCDVLIVGSGYGGAVAATRLAALADKDGRPLRVIVVERGREYLPGMFPSRTADLAGHVRISRQDGKRPRGPATALWDIRLGDDVNVVLGSGLGGGSLINAAVMERPEPLVWQEGWPEGLNASALHDSYEKATAMLQAEPTPEARLKPKFHALQQLGDGLADRPRIQVCRIAVAHQDGHTPAGIERKQCIQCGDCGTGCNFQAKHSLDTNYLAMAKRGGVDFYCGVLARRIHCVTRATLPGSKPEWQLEWSPTDDTLPWAGRAPLIRARRLVVAAGSLGSTELLLRSRHQEGTHSFSGARSGPAEGNRNDGRKDEGGKDGDAGDDDQPQPQPHAQAQPQVRSLYFSPALGTRFSANGDGLAAAIRLPVQTRICAQESTPFELRNIGPTITGMLRSGKGAYRFTAQEFAIPAPLRSILGEVTASVGVLQRLTRHDWTLHRPWQRGDDPLSPGDDAIDHTMVYGLMGDDGAGGRLELTPWRRLAGSRTAGLLDPKYQADPGNPLWDACISVQWPELRYATVYDAQHRALADAFACGYRGTYIPNPTWRPLPDALDQLARGAGVRGPSTTVHPLGGCPMGATVLDGVVDAWGRVFDAGSALLGNRSVHDGLVVLDGAIVPRALGINPALTIAALAEHAMDRLQVEWKLAPRIDKPSTLPPQPVWVRPQPRPEQPRTGVRLLERLQGTVEFDGRRYWAVLQVRFSPIDDVAAFARSLPRIAGFDRASLRLYPDRSGREDEAQWNGQREMDVAPLWAVQLSGSADVLFRYASWWFCRVMRMSFGDSVARASEEGRSLPRWTKLAIASNLGERRGLDYLLHVDRVSGEDCPLQPGDQLRGRKVIAYAPDANPWRQLSEMTLQWRRRGSWRYATVGGLALDLRYFVRQRTALLALHRQADMATALTDLGVLALFCLRVVVKIHLLKFVPPTKKPRDIGLRRPAELPGLDILRVRLSRNVLLTRYRRSTESERGQPIVLFHGYTASGSTFAHPSIPINLVQFLCEERRDVWVAELPTSIAFDKRDARDMSFEGVARSIPEIVLYVSRRYGGPVDMLGHCIGAAMCCYALLSHKRLHASVRSLVLSQVGPLFQVSPANQLRGYMASYLAQFLGTEMLDARPDFRAGGAIGMGQTLLDAVLASLPYPERDLERVLAETAVDQGRPDFRIVRHRADAMLGRLFELTADSPIAPATLDALDDIFGYARVKTLAQTIHYTRLMLLSGIKGRNLKVTSNLVSTRMAFPVLLLHGRRSGVFDWRGSLESYEWLRRSSIDQAPLARSRNLRNEEMLHLGMGSPRQLCIFEKFGHQDCMIGTRAPSVVFPVIAEFLRRLPTNWPALAQGTNVAPARARRSYGPTDEAGAMPTPNDLPPLPTPWVARLPWIGPVIGWLRASRASGCVDVSVLLHPSPMHARTRFVALIQMHRTHGGWRRVPQADILLWEDLGGQPYRLAAELPNPAPPIASVHELSPRDKAGVLNVLAGAKYSRGAHPRSWGLPPEYGQTPRGGPEEADLTANIGPEMRRVAPSLEVSPGQADGVDTALLFLTVHNDLPEREDLNQVDQANLTQMRGGLKVLCKLRRTEETFFNLMGVRQFAARVPIQRSQALSNAQRAVLRFLDDAPANLEAGLMRLSQEVLQAADRRKPDQPRQVKEPLCFAMGSCQYPPGLLDQELAQASYQRLAARLDAPARPNLARPQLLLLLGDQVYVDENAGLFDPVTKEAPFDQIYERSFGMPAFRSVASRLPTFMLLDDHEVRDNWQPGRPIHKSDPRDLRALNRYLEWQASLHPRRKQRADRRAANFFAAPSGWPLFVLDTRSQRQVRTPDNFGEAHIVPFNRLNRLVQWLSALEKRSPGCPKFVASGSVLLPLERSLALAGHSPLTDAGPEPRWSSDGWSGYPASRSFLLGEIVRRRIRNVVFLSGDLHLSMASEACLALVSPDGKAQGAELKVYSVVSSGLYTPWRFANAQTSDYVKSDLLNLRIQPAQGDAFAPLQFVRGTVDTSFFGTNGFAIVKVEHQAGEHYQLSVEFDPACGAAPHCFQLS